MATDGKAIAVVFHGSPHSASATTCWLCARRKCGGADALQVEFDAERCGEVNAYDCDDIEPGESLRCDACGVVIWRCPLPDECSECGHPRELHRPWGCPDSDCDCTKAAT